MTEQITRQRLANEGNWRIRDRCNSGISWGTNNYPANSDPGWFGGTTGGFGHTLSRGNFAAGEPNVAQTVAALRAFANNWGGVRLTRILIYRTKSGYSSGNGDILEYDGTAVANTAYGVGNFAASAAMSTMRDGVDMDLAGLQTALDDLWNTYVAYARNNTATLSRVICHTSCHSNCHCARGRR